MGVNSEGRAAAEVLADLSWPARSCQFAAAGGPGAAPVTKPKEESSAHHHFASKPL